MIERAVYQLLGADPDIGALVDGRIYVDVKDDNSVGSYLVVTLVAGRRPLNLSLASGQKYSSIQIDAYAADAEEARQISEKIILLFHGKSAQADNHDIQVSLLSGEPRPSYEIDTELRRLSIELGFYYH